MVLSEGMGVNYRISKFQGLGVAHRGSVLWDSGEGVPSARDHAQVRISVIKIAIVQVLRILEMVITRPLGIYLSDHVASHKSPMGTQI